jgi:hypothetical protein
MPSGKYAHYWWREQDPLAPANMRESRKIAASAKLSGNGCRILAANAHRLRRIGAAL